MLWQDAPLGLLPADRRVVLVLELVLASGSGSDGGVAGLGRELVLGWAAVAPFRWHGQGASSPVAVLAEGPHQVTEEEGSPAPGMREQST